METRSEQGTRREDESPRRGVENPRPEEKRPRTLAPLASVIFILAGGLNLLSGEWLSAAFFLAGGFVFFKGREIERWPKAARALLIIVLAALAVAMFVTLTFKMKGRG
jgi:hypothetical protein